MSNPNSLLAIATRVHIFAHPSVKPAMITCFSSVLGCNEPEAFEIGGLSEPILAWQFPGGGSLSVEFTEDALDEAQARRGAWLELRAGNPQALRARVIAAGYTQIRHLGNDNYFVIPSGQVFRVEEA
jgi:hypothetical protein